MTGLRKFSELSDDERYKLGQKMGEKLSGTASYPEAEMECFLENEGIYDDKDPTFDDRFCAGLDDTSMCCAGCNWYGEPEELVNELCSDCRGGDGEEE
jgi:hypothetical protein